jgi:2-hydroxychromene-2-carboxylate isomerase
MKALDFWFDPVSPYAYLAFENLPEALVGFSYHVRYRPILFGALLKAFDHKGPAEIAPKRAWTYRQVTWLAHQSAIEFAMPAHHPFNPLALLRLAWATAAPGGTPNRRVCELVLRHVWRGGADANDAGRLAALLQELAPRLDPTSDEVKQRLRDGTAHALEAGVFGVPTIGVDGRLFWGLDALPMVAAAMRGDAWFDGPDWQREGERGPGLVRG